MSKICAATVKLEVYDLIFCSIYRQTRSKRFLFAPKNFVCFQSIATFLMNADYALFVGNKQMERYFRRYLVITYLIYLRFAEIIVFQEKKDVP